MKAEDLFQQLEEKPFLHDFYGTLRQLESIFRDKPRIGTAARPQDEPVRFAQEPSLGFAPSAISAFQPADSKRLPRLFQRFFGLLGPNGPLPLHLTELARERIIHHRDHTFARFLDVFHHRFTALFYRAWAQAQPTASFDRRNDDRFSDYVGSLIGIGTPQLQGRDAAGDEVKLFFSGWLSRQVRSADGLASIIRGYLQLPAHVESFVGHWMPLPDSERTRLGSTGSGSQLGVGAVVGGRVWDRQHKIRLHVGPLTLAQYETLLPTGPSLPGVIALVRQYLCHEFEWDLRLTLHGTEVPRVRLGQYGRLGWTTWIGNYRKGIPASNLTLDAEHACTLKTT